MSSSLTIAASPTKSKKEYTKVFYGGETAINLVLRFLSETNKTIDACVDNTRPSLAIDILYSGRLLPTQKREVLN